MIRVKSYFKKFWIDNPKFRKVAGITLIVIGIIGIITPFTPFGFLLVVGLGILGVRLAFWEYIKEWFKNK